MVWNYLEFGTLSADSSKTLQARSKQQNGYGDPYSDSRYGG